MIFDPVYWLFVLPALFFAMYAQFKVKHAFAKYSKIGNSSGMTGAQAAARMLSEAGVHGVGIERVSGFLSDHYDPRKKVLRLSPEVHDGRSLASVGVACHEVGHAIQDARNYKPLVIRNAIVPTAGIGSQLGIILIFIGAMLNAGGSLLGLNIAIIGLVLFGSVVVFQLVNLPVEFDASKRAKQMLPQMGIIGGRQEQEGVSAVLGAAAMTYVAATISAIMTLLYYVYLIFGRRN